MSNSDTRRQTANPAFWTREMWFMIALIYLFITSTVGFLVWFLLWWF
jgi:hypothetical protein